MDLRYRQLQALHAVIDAGTVSAATRILGISQPGISNLLAQLENQTTDVPTDAWTAGSNTRSNGAV